MKILSVVALLLAPAFTVNIKERLQAQAMSTTEDYPSVENVDNIADLPFIALGDHDY